MTTLIRCDLLPRLSLRTSVFWKTSALRTGRLIHRRGVELSPCKKGMSLIQIKKPQTKERDYPKRGSFKKRPPNWISILCAADIAVNNYRPKQAESITNGFTPVKSLTNVVTARKHSQILRCLKLTRESILGRNPSLAPSAIRNFSSHRTDGRTRGSTRVKSPTRVPSVGIVSLPPLGATSTRRNSTRRRRGTTANTVRKFSQDLRITVLT